MTPEEKQQFEELQKKVTDLERVENVDFIANLIERLNGSVLTNPSDFDDTGISGTLNANVNLRDTTITIPVGGGSGTVTHLDAPDKFLVYTYRGKRYQIWANQI